MELSSLNQLSSDLGNDLFQVQGAGGNTSFKDDTTMWVKASGKWLAHAKEQDIFVPVDNLRLAQDVEQGLENDLNGYKLDDSPLRPSIETTMHAVLPQAYVAHVHSVHVLCHVVQEAGQALLSEELPELSWCWVPYLKPGFGLCQAVVERRQPGTEVVFLANHGVVYAGETCEQIRALLAAVEGALKVDAREQAAIDLSRLETLGDKTGYRLPSDTRIHSLATDSVSLAHSQSGPLYPDHVVFLGPETYYGDERQVADDLTVQEGAPPYLIFPGVGVLVHPDLADAGQAMLSCYAEVLARVPEGAALRALTQDECFALLNWDAEKYRQQLKDN